jgi:hypothetical protein
MPTHKQGTTTAIPGAGYGTGTATSLGSANHGVQAASFPGSPLNTVDQLTDDGSSSPSKMADWYTTNVLQAVINDGGHTFGTQDMDWGNNIPEGEISNDGGGAPANAFVPNTVSPGEGSTNPADQPPAPDEIANMGPHDVFGTGVGSSLPVADSSTTQNTAAIGTLASGKSPGSE